MLVIALAGAALIAAALLNFFLHRPDEDALLQHERALAALRDLAEHPHPIADVAPRHVDVPTDHVKILVGDTPPTLRRRPHRTQPAARRRPRERARKGDAHLARPTVAQLPTLGAAGSLPPGDPVHPGHPALPVAALPAAVSRWPMPKRRSNVRLVALGTAGLVVGVAVAAGVRAAVPSGSPRARVAETAPTRPTRLESTTTAAPPATAPPPVVVVATATGANVTVAAPFRLSLRATGRCWVRVTTDTGRTLLEGTLLPGQDQEIEATEPLVVRLGNTPAMTLAVNGASLDLGGVRRTADVHFAAS